MQLPELLIKHNIVIEILNTLGLGLLGVGLIVLYRALVTRSKLLSASIIEIKKAYQSVLDLMDRRTALIDKRFEDEKSFRGLYLSFFEDSDVHLKRIKKWQEDEVTHLQGEVTQLSEQLKATEYKLQEKVIENVELRERLKECAEEQQNMMFQNRELTPAPAPNVRGLI